MGVIGVGRIGRVHIESIQSIKDATVVMVRAFAHLLARHISMIIIIHRTHLTHPPTTTHPSNP